MLEEVQIIEKISDQESSDGSTGEAYVWEGFKSGEPQCLSAIIGSTSVKTVSLGGQHAALLTVDGRLFMYGNNERGQLGVGSTTTSFISAQNMQLVLADEFVADVSCGRDHTACVTRSGYVFCWGDNSYSQCGTPRDKCYVSPQLVQCVARAAKYMVAGLNSEIKNCHESSVDNERQGVAHDKHQPVKDARYTAAYLESCVSVKIVKVTCGMMHTMALSDDGCLWTWGAGSQLGLGDCSVASVPRCVELPIDRRVIGISCGEQHTVALVVRRGENDMTERRLSGCFMDRRCVEKICENHEVSNDQKIASNGSVVDDINVAAHKAKDFKKITNSELYEDSDTCSFAGLKQQENRSKSENSDIELKVIHSNNDDQASGGLSTANCSSSSAVNRLIESSLTKSMDLGDHLPVDVDSSELQTIPVLADRSDWLSASCQQSAIIESSIAAEDSSATAHERMSLAVVPKSRSSFLDETQAKEFLQRQLSDMDSATALTGVESRNVGGSKEEQGTLEKKDSIDTVPSASPFARTVGTLWQHVPSSPVVVQEYVTNLTRSVVSNLRTSMDRRFNFVTSQVEMSLSGLVSLSKVPISDDGDANALCNDVELLGRLTHTGTMTTVSKSSTMDFEQTRFTHHRNGSLPIGAIELARNEFVTSKLCEKVHLETEVWSWGCGTHGQLGHTDFLDRFLPCQVASLDDSHIVKVVAGSHHSVAVSASCQVFTWGDNSSGQLGHSHSDTSTPYLISVYGRMPVWDIAAGDRHTVILCDGLNSDPHVYFCGSDHSSQCNVLQLSRFSKLKGLGLVQRIYAGGSGQSACVISNTSPMINATFEMAASERLFHISLDKIDQLFMQPLMQLEMANKSCDSMRSLQPLTCELKLISQLSAESHLHLTNILRDIPSCNLASILHTYLLRDTNGRLSAFQRYAKIFADSCVCGAFDSCVKTNRGFFDKVKSEFREILEESKIDVNNYDYTFQSLLQLPLQRPREYHKILNKIAQLYPAYSQEHARLNKLSQTWQSLKQKISVDYELMEKTIGYWRTAPAKIVEALQIAERRLIRDSRTHPLLLSTAGRFSSSHVFLLFNDCFVHIQYSGHQVYHLCTVWVEIVPDSKQLKNAILLSMPEDFITLTTPSHSDKAEWIWCLNQTIARALVDGKAASMVEALNGHASNGASSCAAVVPLAPPRDRHFSYTFTKAGPLKDAQYKGMWRSSKIHGHGELVWPDGRRYCGQFVDGQFEGYGVHTQPTDDLGVEISEGMWKSGLLHGWARVRYSNGDVYKGEFVDGKKHGHGVLKQGKFTASLANIYIGQWQADKRHGYGVCDDIPKGQKYMGMWVDDNRHGNGIIVTLDGLYFEGNFVNGKITGQGLLITEDNCCYEGEFAGGPNLSGKGVLTLPNGDYIEGVFNGSFSEGIKINGTYRKAVIDHASSNTKLALTYSTATALPNRYGQLCVSANNKWDELFNRCSLQLLGSLNSDLQPTVELSQKVWSNIAAALNNATSYILRPKRKQMKITFDVELQRIPNLSATTLTLESYEAIRLYLAKAFEANIHPLSELLNSLVDAFLATYVGVGSHLRLLHHAVDELKSYIKRLYEIIRFMFPALPDTHHPTHVYFEVCSQDHHQVSSDDGEIVTPASLLYAFLLPKIYPPLFNLYALYNEKDDDRYWKRIRLWNKQSNVALMAYLGVDRKFWLCNADQGPTESVCQQKSVHGDDPFSESIDRLQRISTSFSPCEKLSQIQLAFDEINKWCMDDLFPVFQYIVVRSRIQHLAAEIHFIDDLMEPHLQHGELGIMFTTLKACYYQILNEKVV